MALKFLNKKGWHTGSLRNIENVWKAEQKHEAEQKKLEELRKQIHEERERAEFRQLQEQAGLIPKQERLDFLYESGLAVGKGSSGFKALESLPKNDPETTAPSSSNAAAASASASASAAKQQSVPGALFEEKEKPQSANEAWRKLHSDPLLLIRQKEQEALARVKNNPVQMAMIRKSVEAKKKDKDEKKHRTKHHKKKSKRHKYSSSENDSDSEDTAFKVKKQSGSHHKGSKSDKPSRRVPRSSDEELSEKDARRKRDNDEYKEAKPGDHPDLKNYISDVEQKKRSRYDSQRQEYSSERLVDSHYDKRSHYNEYNAGRRDGNPDPKLDKNDGEQKRKKSYYDSEWAEYASERQSESHKDKQSHFISSQKPPRHGSNNRHRNPVKLSEEERAARLREMERDAERHEEQRWKRLKNAADTDAQEAVHDRASLGRNFLDAAHKSIYGAEKGGSSTIEESVRRRTHYSQGKSDTDTNAFRRQ